MTRNSVAVWLVALFGIGLIVIGAASLISTQSAADAFGVPASRASTPAYVWAAGIRDIAIGFFVMVLLAYRVKARILGALMFVAALIPAGDLINVYVNMGVSSRAPLVLHGASVLFLVGLGWILRRSA